MSEGGNNGIQSAISLFERGLFIYCQSGLLSEEGLRQFFEATPQVEINHLSNYKFFYAALYNERRTEGIIHCLLEFFPAAASATDRRGGTPLHSACDFPNVTFEIIQLLISASPASVRTVTDDGSMPLHQLCMNSKLDDATGLKILKLLIEKYPEAVRHANNRGRLPIHIAAFFTKSLEFCRVLIEAYPGSERITDGNDALLLHHACSRGSLATVEYVYRLLEDAIVHVDDTGLYPIHYAIYNPTAGVEIVQFLLDCDPNLIQYKRKPLFHWACTAGYNYNDSHIEAGIQIIKILFDAHPFAIEHNRIAADIQQCHQQVQAFVNGELVNARQANDHHLMITTDENGQLPLHRALQNNVRLGSIKLLVKGNPPALQSGDIGGALPLHVACEHHDSTNVVGYLIELDTTSLSALDKDGNTALHYACRGAKYETIALLLEKFGAASVSKRNAHGKLPIDMLWESKEVDDRESVEYTEIVFQLLKAYPEMV